MASNEGTPRLRFARSFSERDAIETRDRGYLSHVLVELDRGRLFPVFFYDPVRLQQDLEELANHGRPFIAEPGMIVVQDITIETMRQVIDHLHREGFFDALIPVTEDDLALADPYQWPPRRIDRWDGKVAAQCGVATETTTHGKTCA